VEWQTRRVPDTRPKPDGYRYGYGFLPAGMSMGTNFYPATPLLTGGELLYPTRIRAVVIPTYDNEKLIDNISQPHSIRHHPSVVRHMMLHDRHECYPLRSQQMSLVFFPRLSRSYGSCLSLEFLIYRSVLSINQTDFAENWHCQFLCFKCTKNAEKLKKKQTWAIQWLVGILDTLYNKNLKHKWKRSTHTIYHKIKHRNT
jgi:hypothetical protein